MFWFHGLQLQEQLNFTLRCILQDLTDWESSGFWKQTCLVVNVDAYVHKNIKWMELEEQIKRLKHNKQIKEKLVAFGEIIINNSWKH